jgi:polysaccharide pyruvyl transferase WcaK-like protein
MTSAQRIRASAAESFLFYRRQCANLGLDLLARSSRVLRQLGMIRRSTASALLLPPAAPGSLGDEAMVLSTVAALREVGVNRIGIVVLGAGEWQKWQGDVEIVDLVSRRWTLAKLRFLLAALRFGRFYCLGADIMDGRYSPQGPMRITELAGLASKAGIPTSILSFSFSDRPTEGALHALRKLPDDVRLCVRDPISHERVSSRLNRAADLVADAAFLLEPQLDTRTVAKTSHWINEEHERSRIVIGVNLNHRLYLSSGRDALDDVVAKLSDALVALFSSRSDLSFLLIPHDYRPYKQYPGDAEVAESVLCRLPRELRARTLVLTHPCRAAEVKAICGSLDLVVTGLMHLAIGSLGQGTPVACLPYQGKFDGLMSHFGLRGSITDPAGVLDGDKLARFVVPLIERRVQTRAKIEAALPRIRRLAQANFTEHVNTARNAPH